MKDNNQLIGCTVDHCKHYNENFCSLDKIKVAKCGTDGDKEAKEATMCDSYDSE